MSVYAYVYIHITKCFIHTHCRRLCKTTEIFVAIKNVFFLSNIHANTSRFCLFNFFCIYIHIDKNIYSSKEFYNVVIVATCTQCLRAFVFWFVSLS